MKQNNQFGHHGEKGLRKFILSLISKTNLYRLNYTNLTRNKLLGHLPTLGAKYRKSDDENNDSPINFE